MLLETEIEDMERRIREKVEGEMAVSIKRDQRALWTLVYTEGIKRGQAAIYRRAKADHAVKAFRAQFLGLDYEDDDKTGTEYTKYRYTTEEGLCERHR